MTNEQRASLPFYSPRIWHGMTSGVWFPFLRENRFAVAPSRWPMAVAISGVSVINSVLRGMSELCYRRKAEQAQLESSPLFVIGHWRTGTTLVHELLVQDDRFTYPTTYQCLAPHHFLLTSRFLGPAIDLLMPRKRPMDNMKVGHKRPQEDEFALLNLGVGSNYMDWAFPNSGDDHDDYLTLHDLSDEELTVWKHTFAWFVNRLALQDSRRLVLKSPTHTARVSTILEMYPDAKFLHVVRHPFKVIPSTIRTWTRMTDALSFQVRQNEYSLDGRLDVFRKMYDCFNTERHQIKSSNFHTIRYEDLVADPLEELSKTYRVLELGDFATAREKISAYLESTKDFKGNTHDLTPEVQSTIRARCQDYMNEFGYE